MVEKQDGQKHPYFLCFNKECGSFSKSIRRDVIEGKFEVILETLQPTPSAFELTRAMFKDAWDQRGAHVAAKAKPACDHLRGIEKQIEQSVLRKSETC